METGWEPGQEAGHPLTGDKLISSCSSFLTKIKRSIKDKRARDGLAKAVGAALSTEQRMLCFSFKAISEGKKHCLTPQHLGQDGSCSSSSRLRHACEALLHPEQPHDSCQGSRRAQKQRKDFAVSSSEKKMICSKKCLSDYAEDESAIDQRDREQQRNLTGNIFL